MVVCATPTGVGGVSVVAFACLGRLPVARVAVGASLHRLVVCARGLFCPRCTASFGVLWLALCVYCEFECATRRLWLAPGNAPRPPLPLFFVCVHHMCIYLPHFLLVCCWVTFCFLSCPPNTARKVAALLSDMVPRDGGAFPGGTARAGGHPDAAGGGGESIRNGADPMEQVPFYCLWQFHVSFRFVWFSNACGFTFIRGEKGSNFLLSFRPFGETDFVLTDSLPLCCPVLA